MYVSVLVKQLVHTFGTASFYAEVPDKGLVVKKFDRVRQIW